MPQIQPTVNLAKIQIPTGYEQLQRQAATKRRLAETMLAQGLTPDNNMNNWTQVLAKFAQTWAGKSLTKDADKAEVEYQNRLRGDFQTRLAQFTQDAKTLSPAQMVERYRGDPLVADLLGPYEATFEDGMKARQRGAIDLENEDQKWITFGGRRVRAGDIKGQYENNPTSMVHATPDGQMSINPVAATAAAIGQGNLVPAGPPQTVGQIPGTTKVAQAMATASQPEAVDEAGLRNLQGTMTPGQLANYLRQGNVKVKVNDPSDIQRLGLPPGTQLLLPDGTIGEVP